MCIIYVFAECNTGQRPDPPNRPESHNVIKRPLLSQSTRTFWTVYAQALKQQSILPIFTATVETWSGFLVVRFLQAFFFSAVPVLR